MKENNKTILITGASSGIGRELALKLAKEGFTVFAGIRKKIDKTELEKLNKNIKGVYIDITIPSSVDKAFWFVVKNTERIDVLVNNAGIAIAGPVESLSIAQIREQFEVNTFGALSVVQKFMPLLNNSKIINISSMAASGIFPYISPYCASKRALDILFNSFAIENKSNIKVISVKPSSVKTPIWEKSVKRAKTNFESFHQSEKEKYSQELFSLEKQALKNTSKGIEIDAVIKVILKIIKAKNPKPSYNVGFQALFTEIISKLPQSVINFLVKLILKNKFN